MPRIHILIAVEQDRTGVKNFTIVHTYRLLQYFDPIRLKFNQVDNLVHF